MPTKLKLLNSSDELLHLRWSSVYLLEDKVDGASGVDVHEVNFRVIINELGAPRHSVGEAALDLQRQSGG